MTETSGGHVMSRAESELRQEMRDETEELSYETSVSAIRARARRRARTRAGVAVLLTAAVAMVAAGPSLLRMARPAGPVDTLWPSRPSVTPIQPTALPRWPAATRDDPIRTGVTLADRRELVLWFAPGPDTHWLNSLQPGARDANGTVTALPMISGVFISWVDPHLFHSPLYFADGPSGTAILFGNITGPVSRITASWGGQTVDVPLVRHRPDGAVYWVAGLPQRTNESDRLFPHLRAYDAAGTLIDWI